MLMLAYANHSMNSLFRMQDYCITSALCPLKELKRGLNTVKSSIHNIQAKKKTHTADVLPYLWNVNLVSQEVE